MIKSILKWDEPIGRMDYFTKTFFLMFIQLAVGITYGILLVEPILYYTAFVLLFISTVPFYIALAMRRLKDLQFTPWLACFLFVPIISFVLNIILYILPAPKNKI